MHSLAMALVICMAMSYIVPVSFATDAETVVYDFVEYVYHRDFWKDTQTDVLFARTDAVINRGSLEENMEALKEITGSASRGGFVSIMIHEEYFYPDYTGYLPDFADRVLDTCRYLFEKGYEGRRLKDVDPFGDLLVV